MTHWNDFYLFYQIKILLILKQYAESYECLRGYQSHVQEVEDSLDCFFSSENQVVAVSTSQQWGAKRAYIGPLTSFQIDQQPMRSHRIEHKALKTLAYQLYANKIGTPREPVMPAGVSFSVVAPSIATMIVKDSEVTLGPEWLESFSCASLHIVSNAPIHWVGDGRHVGRLVFEGPSIVFSGYTSFECMTIRAGQIQVSGYVCVASDYEIEADHLELSGGMWEDPSSETAVRAMNLRTGRVARDALMSLSSAALEVDAWAIEGGMAVFQGRLLSRQVSGAGSVLLQEVHSTIHELSLACVEQMGGRLEIHTWALLNGVYESSIGGDHEINTCVLSGVGVWRLQAERDLCVPRLEVSGEWRLVSDVGARVDAVWLEPKALLKLEQGEWTMRQVTLSEASELHALYARVYSDLIIAWEEDTQARVVGYGGHFYVQKFLASTLTLMMDPPSLTSVFSSDLMSSHHDKVRYLFETPEQPLSLDLGYTYLLDHMPSCVIQPDEARFYVQKLISMRYPSVDYLTQSHTIGRAIFKQRQTEHSCFLVECRNVSTWSAFYVRTPKGSFALSDLDEEDGVRTAEYRAHDYELWAWVLYVVYFGDVPVNPWEAVRLIWTASHARMRLYLSCLFPIPFVYVAGEGGRLQRWCSQELDWARYMLPGSEETALTYALLRSHSLYGLFELLLLQHKDIHSKFQMLEDPDICLSSCIEDIRATCVELRGVTLLTERLDTDACDTFASRIVVADHMHVLRMSSHHSLSSVASRGTYVLGPHSASSYFSHSMLQGDHGDFAAPSMWFGSLSEFKNICHHDHAVCTASQYEHRRMRVMFESSLTHDGVLALGEDWTLFGRVEAQMSDWKVARLGLYDASLSSGSVESSELTLWGQQVWNEWSLRSEAVHLLGSLLCHGSASRFWGHLTIDHGSHFEQGIPEAKGPQAWDRLSSLYLLGEAHCRGRWTVKEAVRIMGRVTAEHWNLVAFGNIRFEKRSVLEGSGVKIESAQRVVQKGKVALTGFYAVDAEHIYVHGDLETARVSLHATKKLSMHGSIQAQKVQLTSDYLLRSTAAIMASDSVDLSSMLLYQTGHVHARETSVTALGSFGFFSNYVFDPSRYVSKKTCGYLAIQAAIYGLCAYYQSPLLLWSTIQESSRCLKAIQEAYASECDASSVGVDTTPFHLRAWRSLKTLSVWVAQYYAVPPVLAWPSFYSFMLRHWLQQSSSVSRTVGVDLLFGIHVSSGTRCEALCHVSGQAAFSIVDDRRAILYADCSLSGAVATVHHHDRSCEGGVSAVGVDVRFVTHQESWGRHERMMSFYQFQHWACYGRHHHRSGAIMVQEMTLMPHAVCSFRPDPYLESAFEWQIIRRIWDMCPNELTEFLSQRRWRVGSCRVAQEGQLHLERSVCVMDRLLQEGRMSVMASEIYLKDAQVSGTLSWQKGRFYWDRLVVSEEGSCEASGLSFGKKLYLEGKLTLAHERFIFGMCHAGERSEIRWHASHVSVCAAEFHGRQILFGENQLDAASANYDRTAVLVGDGDLLLFSEEGVFMAEVHIEHLAIKYGRGEDWRDVIESRGMYSACRPKHLSCWVDQSVLIDRDLRRKLGGFSIIAPEIHVRSSELSSEGHVGLCARALSIQNSSFSCASLGLDGRSVMLGHSSFFSSAFLSLHSEEALIMNAVILRTKEGLFHVGHHALMRDSVLYADSLCIRAQGEIRLYGMRLVAMQDVKLHGEGDIFVGLSGAHTDPLMGMTQIMGGSVSLYSAHGQIDCEGVIVCAEYYYHCEAHNDIRVHPARRGGHGVFESTPSAFLSRGTEEVSVMRSREGSIFLYGTELHASGALSLEAKHLYGLEVRHTHQRLRRFGSKAFYAAWRRFSDPYGFKSFWSACGHLGQASGMRAAMNLLNVGIQSGRIIDFLRQSHGVDLARAVIGWRYGFIDPSASCVLAYHRQVVRISSAYGVSIVAQDLRLKAEEMLFYGTISAEVGTFTGKKFALHAIRQRYASCEQRYAFKLEWAPGVCAFSFGVRAREASSLMDQASVCHVAHLTVDLERLDVQGSEMRLGRLQGHLGAVSVQDGEVIETQSEKNYILGCWRVGLLKESQRVSYAVPAVCDIADNRSDWGVAGRYRVVSVGADKGRVLESHDAYLQWYEGGCSVAQSHAQWREHEGVMEMMHQERMALECDQRHLLAWRNLCDRSETLPGQVARAWGVSYEEACAQIQLSFLLAEQVYAHTPPTAEQLAGHQLSFKERIEILETGLVVQIYETASGDVWMVFEGTPMDFGAAMWRALCYDDLPLMWGGTTSSLDYLLSDQRMQPYLSRDTKLRLTGHSRGAAVAMELVERVGRPAEALVFDSPKRSMGGRCVSLQGTRNMVNRCAQGGWHLRGRDHGADLFFLMSPSVISLGLFVSEEYHKHRIHRMKAEYDRDPDQILHASVG